MTNVGKTKPMPPENAAAQAVTIAAASKTAVYFSAEDATAL